MHAGAWFCPLNFSPPAPALPRSGSVQQKHCNVYEQILKKAASAPPGIRFALVTPKNAQRFPLPVRLDPNVLPDVVELLRQHSGK